MTPPASASQDGTLAIILGAIAVISFVLNLIQFFSNKSKERRLKNYEKYEYSAHLQLTHQEKVIGSGTPDTSFRYSATIENCGSKSIHIKNVLLEYGSEKDSSKRYKYVIERGFYLKAGDQKAFQQEISPAQVREARTKFGLEECHFSLRVSFIDPSGSVREKELPLAYMGPNKTIVDVNSWIIA